MISKIQDDAKIDKELLLRLGYILVNENLLNLLKRVLFTNLILKETERHLF